MHRAARTPIRDRIFIRRNRERMTIWIYLFLHFPESHPEEIDFPKARQSPARENCPEAHLRYLACLRRVFEKQQLRKATTHTNTFLSRKNGISSSMSMGLVTLKRRSHCTHCAHRERPSIVELLQIVALCR